MKKRKKPERFDIFLTRLDPTEGSEIQKTRPCVIVSPNEANNAFRTVVIAPMSSSLKYYNTHIQLRFQGLDGEIQLEQIRTVDKGRLIKYMGKLDQKTADLLCERLIEFFQK